MGYIIRRRTKDDIKRITHIVTIAWNQTYKQIINTNFLNKLKENEEDRINSSIKDFDDNNNHTFIIDVDGKIVGFVKCVNSNIKGYENIGEIQAMYLIDGYKGYGYGRVLFETGIKELKSLGYKQMVIGCLRGNKANFFYIHMGGKKVSEIMYNFEDEEYPGEVYLFNLDDYNV